MDLKLLDRMGPAELRAYVEFLLWHYRVIDGFWFLFVQERFDQPTAERINERVWHKAAELAARDFVKRFGIGKGLSGFVQALRYFPWTIIIGYEIEEKQDEVVITVPTCGAQRGTRCTEGNLPTSPASSMRASGWSASTHRRMRIRRRISASGASR
jgi:hypothetical protein